MNQKSIQTQHKIENALINLMQNEKYDDIQVKEVTADAAVSRMSFYRNYKVKDDILNFFIKRKYDQFIEDISKNHLRKVGPLLQIYFGYFEKNPLILSAVINAGVEGNMLSKQTEYFNKFFETNLADTPKVTDYDVAYYSGAVFSILLYWCNKGYDISAKELSGRLEEKLKNDFFEVR